MLGMSPTRRVDFLLRDPYVSHMSQQTVLPLPDPQEGLTSQIARALRGVLAERQISGNRLAHETGLSQSRISRRLTGEYPLDTDELDVILTVVGVSIDELLDRAARSPRPDGPDGGRRTVRHPRLERGTRWLSVCAGQSAPDGPEGGADVIAFPGSRRSASTPAGTEAA